MSGLACAGLVCAALAVLLVPRLPGRLAYYGLVAAGSAPTLAIVATAGCLLSAPGALQAGRVRWLARIGLGLSAVGAGVFTAVTASTVMLARAHGLIISIRQLRRVAAPEAPPFDVVTIARGPDWQRAADIYEPRHDRDPRPKPRSAILVIHGGAWSGGDKGENKAWNRWLAARGFVVVDMQYRLAPRAGWRESLADVERGLAWVREHSPDLRIDPDRVFLLGRSAGGHLALLAAYTTSAPLPRGVVALYAPSDLGRLHAQSRHLRAHVEAVVRGDPSGRPDEYGLASPLARVHPGAPPTLLIHGAWDDAVPPEHSRLLARALDRLRVPHQLLEVPFARHAFDIDAGGLASQVALEAVSRFCVKTAT